MRERHSYSTWQNFQQLSALLLPGRYDLVTSAYHQPRALSVGRKQGFTLCPAFAQPYIKTHSTAGSLVLRETIAMLMYFIRGRV